MARITEIIEEGLKVTEIFKRKSKQDRVDAIGRCISDFEKGEIGLFYVFFVAVFIDDKEGAKLVRKCIPLTIRKKEAREWEQNHPGSHVREMFVGGLKANK